MEGFTAQVKGTISRYGMIDRGDTVVVGVSGGADSVALLHVLWSMREDLGIDLVVAHLNHSIRGAEAEADARFVESLALKLGIGSVMEIINVPAIKKKMRVSMEEAAREVRHDFLERVARSADAERIALAHTADDQVETVLLNIMRGTGPDGLSGIPAVRGKIIRPLIDITRSDVEAYLRSENLLWRTDITNLELDYTRNRVRLQLIPLMEQLFNPQVKQAVLTLSKLAGDEAEFVRQAAEKMFAEVTKEVGRNSVMFDAAMLAALPLALQRRCLRMAIEMVKGDLKDVEYTQVQRILDTLVGGEESSFTLPSGKVYASLHDGNLRIFRRVMPKKVDVLQELRVPGRTDVPELDISIETCYVPSQTRPESKSQAVIDSSKLVGTLKVRTWRTGDRIVPLGMRGRKKLQDVFTDLKVPQEERGLLPVIVDDEKIVWVPNIVISEDVKVTEAAKKALMMEQISLD